MCRRPPTLRREGVEEARRPPQPVGSEYRSDDHRCEDNRHDENQAIEERDPHKGPKAPTQDPGPHDRRPRASAGQRQRFASSETHGVLLRSSGFHRTLYRPIHTRRSFWGRAGGRVCLRRCQEHLEGASRLQPRGGLPIIGGHKYLGRGREQSRDTNQFPGIGRSPSSCIRKEGDDPGPVETLPRQAGHVERGDGQWSSELVEEQSGEALEIRRGNRFSRRSWGIAPCGAAFAEE